MKHKLALFFSFIFHPIVFAFLFPFLIVYRTTKNIGYGIEWMLFSFVFIGFSIFVFFLLRPTDVLTDFDLSQRSRRPIFYAVALLFAVLYFIVAIIFKGIFFPLSIVSLGVILGIGVFELVNFYIKASIHLGIACAYIIAVGVLYGFIPALAIIWLPVVIGWSRIHLHRHTKAEVITGGTIGSMVTLATFAIARILMYNK